MKKILIAMNFMFMNEKPAEIASSAGLNFLLIFRKFTFLSWKMWYSLE